MMPWKRGNACDLKQRLGKATDRVSRLHVKDSRHLTLAPESLARNPIFEKFGEHDDEK